jgi:hypothetical protein
VSSSIYEVCNRLLKSLARSEDREYLNEILISREVSKKFQISKIKNILPLELVNGVFEKLISFKKKSKQSPLEEIILIASKYPTSAERDKITFTQLRTTIRRDLVRLLSEKDPRSRLYLKIRKQLKTLEEEGLVENLLVIFYQICGLGSDATYYYKIDEIIDELNWPTCTGKDEGFVMPSPKQVRQKVLEILEKTSSYFRAEDFVDILIKGFGVGKNVISFSASERNSDELENKASIEIEKEGMFHSFSIKQVDDVIDRLTKEIIEEDKGVPLEKDGKLGKFFLDFTLWNGLPISGVTNSYGLRDYRKDSNLSEGQGSFYNKKILNLKVYRECKKRLINPSVMVAVHKELRKRFIHRKPKFIEYPYS